MKSSISRNVFFAFALLLFPFCCVLRASLPEEVVEVLEASLEASGGREALSAIKSSRLKGTFSITAIGMSGSSEIVQTYPDKVYLVQEMPGIGRIEQGYDGEKGWAQDPMQGFRLLSDGEIAMLKQNESFADLLEFEKSFSSGERLADVAVDGEMSSVLKLVSTATGETETRYYSKASGLLIGIDMIADMGPMGRLPASMRIKTYGEQDGVLYPKLMEMTNLGMTISMTFESLELNPSIDDSLFSAPQ